MKASSTKWIAIGLIVGLIIGLAAGFIIMEAQIERKDATISRLQSQIAEMESQIAEKDSLIDEYLGTMIGGSRMSSLRVQQEQLR